MSGLNQPKPRPQGGNRGSNKAANGGIVNENTLEFKDSMSVDAFKTLMGAKKLDVMTNPNTGKVFFSCGGKTGAVTTRATMEEIQENPIISEVYSPENDEVFYLLHVDGGLEADFSL